MKATVPTKALKEWSRGMTIELHIAARTATGRPRGQQPSVDETEAREETEANSTYREVAREIALLPGKRARVSVTDHSTGQVISQSMGVLGPLKGGAGGLMIAFEGDTLTELFISGELYSMGNAWNGGAWLLLGSVELEIQQLAEEIC